VGGCLVVAAWRRHPANPGGLAAHVASGHPCVIRCVRTVMVWHDPVGRSERAAHG
jgi:hypothetical protein